MLQKMRLGKRSPLGALVSSATPAEGTPGHEAGDAGTTVVMGQQSEGTVRGQPLKVYFQCGVTGGTAGVVDQPKLPQSHVSASLSGSRSVSSCIDVPTRQFSAEEADMDELMAAMVLSSLSCSPRLHSLEQHNTTAPLMECGGGGGGEFSDGGSSGYWSVGQCDRSPAPSPPTTETALSPATPPDEGLDIELDQVLFDEPVLRRRRNSAKAVFKCLWPSCSKVLTSVMGIKRHIRTTHLCRGGEHERCSRSEEDFYYTEVSQWEPLQQSLPPPGFYGPAPSPSTSSSPSSTSSPPPPSLSPPPCHALSCSAPSAGSFWQVQSEHSYQAPPPSHVMPAAASNTASTQLWTAPSTSCIRQDLSFRARSVSVGEEWLQHQSAPSRRIRGEAKKCRKVYGIEHREQWCTACRWKKACQRFQD